MAEYTLPKTIKSIRDLNLANRTVFMRLDFNVPLSEPDANGIRKVEEDNRIREALPTINFAIEKGAKIIIASHLGRPDGQRKKEFSLLPAADHLSQLTGKDVTLADDCVGEGIELMAKNLKSGQILMLENLRFHPGEEKNDPDFSKKLARLADLYVTDAFGTAHRKHASTYGLPAMMTEKGVGFLIEKELKYLDPLLDNPQRPFYTILGGAKVTDKIKTIDTLLRTVDGLLIGGAMAYAFSAARGQTPPANAKQPKPADIEAARAIIKHAKEREIPLLLPVDMIEAFDIGPKTVEQFIEVLKKAKTVFWNGPLGWFEKPEYSKGTFAIANALAESTAVKVVGGGDTVSAIHKSGVADKFDHLSTGGGAVLEYLEGKGLPGIDILRVNPNQPML